MAGQRSLANIDPKTRRLNWVSAVGVGLLAYIWVYPMIWSLSLSFRTDDSLRAGTDGLLPEPFTIENYIGVFSSSQTPQWFLNSLIVAVAVTVLHVSLAALAGYAFARIPFKGKRPLFVFVIAGMMIPEQAVFIPMHTMFADLEMHNTYTALILPRLSGAFGVLLMTQFFKAIPKELDEAAAIDNATQLQIFWRVILPLSKPALTTLAIFTFLGAWNDYLWPLVSATDSSMYTLTVGLSSMMGQFGATEQLGFLMAGAISVSLPMIILYIIFQKYIVQGVSMNVGK